MKDTELTPGEQAFLKDLATNTIWSDILEKLGAFGREIPGYKPGKAPTSEQSSDWIFYSGVDHGKKLVLKRLLDGR